MIVRFRPAYSGSVTNTITELTVNTVVRSLRLSEVTSGAPLIIVGVRSCWLLAPLRGLWRVIGVGWSPTSSRWSRSGPLCNSNCDRRSDLGFFMLKEKIMIKKFFIKFFVCDGSVTRANSRRNGFVIRT